MKPAQDSGSVGIGVRVRTGHNADNLHRQGDEQRSSQAQLHAVKASVIFPKKVMRHRTVTGIWITRT